jgi:hypothetical protein
MSYLGISYMDSYNFVAVQLLSFSNAIKTNAATFDAAFVQGWRSPRLVFTP